MIVIFSGRALRQLDKIENYIARKDSPRKAASFVLDIINRCHRIALAPHQGTRLKPFTRGLRKTGYNRKVVIHFLPEDGKVTIVSIAYGGKRP